MNGLICAMFFRSRANALPDVLRCISIADRSAFLKMRLGRL